jgi:hypothetical protein
VAARTPYEAVRAFIRPLQQSLSCITRASLNIRGGYHSGPDHPLTLAGAEPVRLAGDARWALAIEMRYRIVEDAPAIVAARWSVVPSMYVFTLYGPTGDMLIAYHWHPQGRSPIVTPHLHVGSASNANDLLTGAHLPTGNVTLMDVVGLTVRELGVRSLRRDWAAVLDRAERVQSQ